ncbi:MAG: bifunctional UDP-N-acetylglucosamine diphosphorylase/glucosamine-1-phosphate N-acetyltransferase GlmU [Acidobacteria bacterium]|nr:bifunctional UDP-N-acetylglucosamine diphosphorylase/glucosamine-1-phosphate N-acetyltransferase GlmU [Acidobacteriota bacterium]
MQDSVTVVILAAGLGTRMKSRHAKVLHRAGGLSLVEHVVRAALNLAPPERIVTVVGYQAGRVREALSGFGIGFADQAEPKGTGHALMVCRGSLAGRDGMVLVLYGDCPLLSVPTLARLVEAQACSRHAATLITTVLDDPHGYGRVVKDSSGGITAIVEEKAATAQQRLIREINSGIYCFRADLLWKHLPEIGTANPAGEYYLTDMVEILRRHGHSCGTMLLDDSREVLGINTRVDLAVADRIFRECKVRELMLAGVTIEKPETVTVDEDVSIGPDSILEPFTRILGRTRIGENCRIGACSMVTDSTLGDGVQVGPFSIIGTSVVEAGAQIGPYARLRLENHVGAGACVGNFVELKKTRLGAGSKAMHLAYLGDATIGKDVNIGAGAITCNFDGVAKNPTHIHDGAFVGSNSTLVAPVEIGAGSYVAAGSVITKSVPANSLAVAREHQVVKEDWAKRRREKARS